MKCGNCNSHNANILVAPRVISFIGIIGLLVSIFIFWNASLLLLFMFLTAFGLGWMMNAKQWRAVKQVGLTITIICGVLWFLAGSLSTYMTWFLILGIFALIIGLVKETKTIGIVKCYDCGYKWIEGEESTS